MMPMKTFVLLLAGICATIADPAEECTFTTIRLFGHETDCTKFYQCTNTGWVVMNCAPGTHFNNDLGVCDWPESANCQTVEPPPPPTTCTELTMRWIDDINCSLFEYCFGGEWRRYKCPSGYRFDPVRNSCYHKTQYACPTIPCDAAPCKNGATCTDVGTTNYNCQCASGYSGKNCDQQVTTTTTTTTPSPTTCTNGEPYRAYASDCRKFEACIGGTWMTFNCPFEVPAFNVSTGLCDYIYNVNCGTRPTICAENTQLAGSNTECTDYYRCQNNQWVKDTCPSSYRFDNTNKQCSLTAFCPTAIIPCTATTCQNGGSCTNSATGFTCACDTGFTGKTCETPFAINGAWGPWVENPNPISGCTKVCGGGTQLYTVTRACDSPAPKNGGLNCTGSATDTISKTCNVGACLCTATLCNTGNCTDISTTSYSCACPPHKIGNQCQTDCQYPCPPTGIFIYPDLLDATKAVVCNKGDVSEVQCQTGETWSVRNHRCV